MLEPRLHAARDGLVDSLIALVLALAIPLRLDGLAGLGVDYAKSEPDGAQVPVCLVAGGFGDYDQPVLK